MSPRWALAVVLLAGVWLSGCAGEAREPTPPVPAFPMRIVSLDFCADQYVLKFVARDRIAAVSPDAEKAFSYMRAAAAGIPKAPATAEAALALKPDLIVRSYGGGPNAGALFQRAGVPVLEIGYAETLPAVRQTVLRVSAALGAASQGGAVADNMHARLQALAPTDGQRPTALYVTPGGVTTGSGSLVDETLRAAGFANFEQAPGWRSIPLERLAYERPDLVAAAAFDEAGGNVDSWSAARHPLAREALRHGPTANIEGAWTACGGWFLADAAEALAKTAPRAKP